MTQKQTPESEATPTKQLSFRYDSERADKITGYAFATRRRASEVLREAIDYWYAAHEKTINKRQV